MIERYTRPEMAAIWTEENKFKAWLEVEILACEAWSELRYNSKRRCSSFFVKKLLLILIVLMKLNKIHVMMLLPLHVPYLKQ